MSLIKSYQITFRGAPWHAQAAVDGDHVRVYALFEDADSTRSGRVFVDYGDAHATPGDIASEVTALSALDFAERRAVFDAVLVSRAVSP